MSKIFFTCTKCFKSLQLQEHVYKKAYEGHDTCLSCRTVDPAKMLTEEIIGLVEYEVEEGNPVFWGHAQELLFEINRLNSRNAKLVHENDELMAENEKLKRAMFTVYDSIFCEMSVPKRLREMFYRIFLIDCKLDPNMRMLEEINHE